MEPAIIEIYVTSFSLLHSINVSSSEVTFCFNNTYFLYLQFIKFNYYHFYYLKIASMGWNSDIICCKFRFNK